MRHASIEPGRMVASEYRLPLTRCLALADLTQEKPPTGGFFVLWVFGINPRGRSLLGHSGAFFGHIGRKSRDEEEPEESRPPMLRRSQWEMLREPAKAHSCTPDVSPCHRNGSTLDCNMKNPEEETNHADPCLPC